MSSLERLQLCGIRSFNPQVQDRQQVIFQRPLTIILGKNGAGKTTVIEALLNATTGEMPPGASAATDRSSFIFDPKIAGETEVKAQIRLAFTTRTQQSMQVVRSFSATQGRTGKTSFSTLDSTIAFRDEATGKVSSSSYRAGDVDQMVPDLMGVTRPVLEHVVFCHQEDCNWPLGPSSDVKKKFDELFASTRYVSALDKLRDKAKEYRAELKGIEASLGAMREQREQAKLIRTQIGQKKQEMREFQSRVGTLEPAINFFEGVISALEGARRLSDTLVHDNATIRGRIDELDKALKKTGVAKEPKDTAAVLRNTVEEMQANRPKGEETVRTLQGQLQEADAKVRELERTVQERITDVKLAEARQSEQGRRVQELQSIVASLPEDMRPGRDGAAQQQQQQQQQLDATALVALEGQLSARVDKARKELAQHSEELRKLNDSVAQERARLHRTMDADGKERELKAQQARAAQKKAADLRRKVQQNAASGSNVSAAAVDAARNAEADVKRRIAEYEQRAASGGQQQRQDSQREVETLMAQIAEAQNGIHAMRDEMRLYGGVKDGLGNQQSIKAGADDHLRKRVLEPLSKEKVQQANALLQQHQQRGGGSGAFFFSSQSAREAEKAAASYKDEKSRAMATAAEERTAAENDLSRVERRLEDQRSVLARAEKELADKNAALSKEKMVAVSNSNDKSSNVSELVERTLAADEERLRRLTTEVSDRKSALECFQQYIEVAQREAKCSVCDRGFEGEDGTQFIAEKQKELATAPGEIDKLRDEKDKLEKRVAALRKLQPTATRAAELAGTVIPAARKEIEQLEAQVGQLQTRRDVTKGDADAAQRHLNAATQILSDAQRASQLFNDYDSACRRSGMGTLNKSAKEKLLQRLSSNSNSSGDNSDSIVAMADNVDALVKQLEQRVRADEVKLSESQSQLIAAQRRVSAAGNEKQLLETELLQCENRRMQLEAQMEQRRALEADAEAAEAEQAEADARIKELDKRRKEVEQQLAQAQSASAGQLQQMTQRRDELAQQEQRLAKSAATLSAGVKSLQSSSSSPSGGANKNKQQSEMSLEAAQKALGEAQHLLAQVEESRKKFREALANAQSMIKQQTALYEKAKAELQWREIADTREERARVYKENEIKIKQSMEGALNDAVEKATRVATFSGNSDDDGSDDGDADEKAKQQAAALVAVKAASNEVKKQKSVEQAREFCRRKATEMEKQRSQWKGSVDTMGSNLQDLMEQLEKEKYKGIDEKYTACFVKHASLEVAVADVDKFYKALEKAVSSYHAEKITQINKLVALYWRSTYRGSDIDTIEIKSEDDGSATSSSSTRRSYKYRVVMKRGGMELDMRGRCSAGQKVLASVIIRLALSEAFCCECGILALDEPTTNLDADNAKALAVALHEIVEQKKNTMRHFQLIIITHDEDFTRAIGARNHDKIFFVEKDRDGAFSLIHEKSYADLFG